MSELLAERDYKLGIVPRVESHLSKSQYAELQDQIGKVDTARSQLPEHRVPSFEEFFTINPPQSN